MESVNEKQELSQFDDLACNYLASFFKEKNNERMEPVRMAIVVLEQIKVASTSIMTDEEDRLLELTQMFLQIKIDILKHFDIDKVKGNTFDDCIQYLEKTAKDALKMRDKEAGKRINNRLNLFINELKKRYV
ncbi:MAG: hypothetical protein II829_05240 [Bacteroidales bacterium]|nr:hypothetical protein [Bacteroidales bacterium]